MLFVLHHKTGTLMLSAQNQEEVRNWSERQLGEEAKRVSIIEGNCMDAGPSVEKDGTGIGTGTDRGCQPVMGFWSDLTQDVFPEHGCSKIPSQGPTDDMPRRAELILH